MFWKSKPDLNSFFNACRGFNIKYAPDYAEGEVMSHRRDSERREYLVSISKIFKKIVGSQIEMSADEYKKLQHISERYQAHAITEDTNSVGSVGVFVEKMFSMKGARILVQH